MTQLSSRDAFKKNAVYDDEAKGRVLPRAERSPAPTTEDRLVTILTEIRAAVQLNAALIAKLKTGEAVNYGEQIARQQDVLIQILNEIKQSNKTEATEEPREVKRFDIERDDKGNMKGVIPVYGDD